MIKASLNLSEKQPRAKHAPYESVMKARTSYMDTQARNPRGQGSVLDDSHSELQQLWDQSTCFKNVPKKIHL